MADNNTVHHVEVVNEHDTVHHVAVHVEDHGTDAEVWVAAVPVDEGRASVERFGSDEALVDRDAAHVQRRSARRWVVRHDGRVVSEAPSRRLAVSYAAAAVYEAVAWDSTWYPA